MCEDGVLWKVFHVRLCFFCFYHVDLVVTLDSVHSPATHSGLSFNFTVIGGHEQTEIWFLTTATGISVSAADVVEGNGVVVGGGSGCHGKIDWVSDSPRTKQVECLLAANTTYYVWLVADSNGLGDDLHVAFPATLGFHIGTCPAYSSRHKCCVEHPDIFIGLVCCGYMSVCMRL